MSELTKDEIETLKSLVKKAGWTPMNTKTGSVWFGGKGWVCLSIRCALLDLT